MLPVAVVKLHDGDLHAVGWGEGPCALVTQKKPLVWEWGFKNIEAPNKTIHLSNSRNENIYTSYFQCFKTFLNKLSIDPKLRK